MPPDTQPPSHHRTDVAIIGAGPVGLFAIFECGMLRFKCHVVDALDAIGGQCAALYPEKPIYDIPGYPRIEAASLIERLVAQAAPFRPTFHLGRQVERIVPRPDGRFDLGVSGGCSIDACAVIVAAGVGAFGPNRPPIEGIERYEGASVHYLVRRRDDMRGKRVVIAGGGDSAVDWAISLSEVARKVSVVHRREKFSAAPESVHRLHALAEAGKIDLVIPYQPVGLEGEGRQIKSVIAQDLDGRIRVLEADVFLPFFGLAMNLGPIAAWGLNLHRNHIVVEPATCATNVPGIFAIGDIASYPGKLKLILSGFAEAALAAHAIHPILRPTEALHFEYSTTTGVPRAG